MLRRLTATAGLTPRLAAALLLAALAPTLLLGAFSAWRLREQARQETIQGSLNLVRAVGFGIDANVQDARRALEAAAALPDIADAPWTPDAAPELQRRLNLLAGRLPLLSAITPLDPQGRPLLPDARSPAAFTPELADNYGGYVSDVFYDDSTHTSYIYIVVEVRDQNLHKKGFLAASLDLTGLQTALADALAPTGEPHPHLLLVDSQGRPLYPPSPGAPASLRHQRPAVDRVLSTLEEGHLTWTDPDGTEWLVVYKSLLGYSRFRGIRWGILLQRPTAEAFAPANQAALHAALAALLAALLAFPAALLLAGWLTRDLRQLGAYARDVGRARDPSPLPPHLLLRADEVGALARTLAAMRLDLQSAQDDLQHQHHALRRAERLSSVGLLAAGVAHEINNPLTTIVGYAALLLEDLPTDHPDHEPLTLIAAEADRVRHIVRGLLDLSRRPSAHLPTDLRPTLHRAAALASAGLDLTHITLRIDAPDGDDLTLRADPQALLQLLMNLIANAADAIHEAQRPGTITLRAQPQPHHLTLTVHDDGPGIPPDLLPRAAEPFFTTKPPGKGTGLGLAVVASLAFDHGALLQIDSPEGGGTVVSVRFPRE